MNKFLVILLALFFCSSNILASEEPAEAIKERGSESISLDFLNESVNAPLVAHSGKRGKKKHAPQRNAVVNSWKPYLLANRYFEPAQTYLFGMNVGCGFLYFSGIKADLQLHQLSGVNNNINANRRADQVLQGKIGYNRTPVFEGELGVKIWQWLDLRLSFIHQGGVFITTNYQFYGSPIGAVPANTTLVPLYNFRSNIGLNAILAKVYVTIPWAFVWKKIAYNLYIGGGVGPGWQSWTHNTVELLINNSGGGANLLNSHSINLKSKFSSNAVWLVDIGFKLKSLIPNLKFSVNLGTKLIGWGQARQIGKVEQQRDFTSNSFPSSAGLFGPFRVKTVYSFTPYMGVRWDF